MSNAVIIRDQTQFRHMARMQWRPVTVSQYSQVMLGMILAGISPLNRVSNFPGEYHVHSFSTVFQDLILM